MYSRHGLLFSFNSEKKLFSFSHETLQEYLIAKKIDHDHEFLNELESNVHADMELPIAYAIELKSEVENNFISTISRINYRLANFVSEDIKEIVDSSNIENMSTFWKESVTHFTSGHQTINEKITPSKGDLIFLSKDAFRYLIRTNQIAKKNYY